MSTTRHQAFWTLVIFLIHLCIFVFRTVAFFFSKSSKLPIDCTEIKWWPWLSRSEVVQVANMDNEQVGLCLIPFFFILYWWRKRPEGMWVEWGPPRYLPRISYKAQQTTPEQTWGSVGRPGLQAPYAWHQVESGNLSSLRLPESPLVKQAWKWYLSTHGFGADQMK